VGGIPVRKPPDPGAGRALLQQWLFNRIEAEQRRWFDAQLSAARAEQGDRILFITFGLVPRRLGKQPLGLTGDDLAAAEACLPGWRPDRWSVADAARILFLASLHGRRPDFSSRFGSLCQTAEMAEAVALYRGLPLYPEPADIEPWVGEGLRTNMRSVFEAIAHENPYPMHYLDTHRWNHMVLKALFVGSRLAPIEGLDERANEELARILRDFAHERWAAGRPVPFEIWRCVGPFARGGALGDLERVLESGTTTEQQAAALALAASPDVDAKVLLQRFPVLASAVENGMLEWAGVQ
jgi:hypothetical protein